MSHPQTSANYDYTICAYAAVCNRPLGHRGQHGGFRPAAITVRRGSKDKALSPREKIAISTYARLGYQQLVAQEMNISVQTVKNHLSQVYLKLGVNNALEAMTVIGWLQFPTQRVQATADLQEEWEHLNAEVTELLEHARVLAGNVEKMSASGQPGLNTETTPDPGEQGAFDDAP